VDRVERKGNDGGGMHMGKALTEDYKGRRRHGHRRKGLDRVTRVWSVVEGEVLRPVTYGMYSGQVYAMAETCHRDLSKCFD
jgi:hypothetical protein